MQIVGYSPTPNPALLVSIEGEVTELDLTSGQTLSYEIGKRQCAGNVRNSHHEACPQTIAPWCPEHEEVWVCARCRGSCLKDEMDCYDEHAIYLAVVAPDSFKVGVTKLDRFETRILEQGADRAALIRTVPNGRIAREIEADIARDLGDRIPTDQKIKGLGTAVDEASWQALLDEYDPITEFEPSYDLELSERPIQETIAVGTVRGVKGRLLVLEWNNSIFVSDLRDLVGHHIHEGSPTPAVQSGLAHFG